MAGTPHKAARLGRYELIAILGRGGMADAFLAVATGMSGFRKLCVVKRVREGTDNEPQLRSMLLAEARLASLLEHPNVVQTFEVGEADGQVYLAMEFLRGQPVHRFSQEIMAKDRVIDPRVSALIVADALRGLHYLHELRDFDDNALGLIHRDVSPHNLFLTYDGQVKVLDFGIAKLTGDHTSATEAGMVKGKLAYMSPEQASGTELDRRTDLYSVGIILWELLARQRLYRGTTPGETLRRLIAEPVPPLPPDVPAALALICAHALEKDPDERYQTAAEMREAIEGWLDAQPTLRRDEVGEKVTSLFLSEREELERLVQEFMRRPSTPAASSETPPPSAALPVLPVVADVGPREQQTRLTPSMPPLPSFERSSPNNRIGSGNWSGNDTAPPPFASYTPPPPSISPARTAPSYPPPGAFSSAPPPYGPPPVRAPISEALVSPALRASVAPPVLAPPPARGPRAAAAILAVGLGFVTLAGLVGGALYLGRRSVRTAEPPAAAGAMTSTAAAVAPHAPEAADAAFIPTEPPLLRLVGSNTVGAELAPALVEAFLKRRGDTGIRRRSGRDEHETAIVAERSGGGEEVVTLRAEGTATAFTALADGSSDVGMASRAIKDSEEQLIAAKGTPDMRSPASEHVLGLDGIAVIVQANNPIHAFDAGYLKKLFDGEVTQWRDAGGNGGAVHLYARDDRSGTYDTFKALVLGDAALPAGTKRFDSSETLADAVAVDPDALGFTSVSTVRNARSVALRLPGGSPTYPSSFTVATESYFLSRRLYLYTTLTASPTAQQFVVFALSSDGQKVVRESGFVDLDVTLQEPVTCTEHCSARYVELTKGARRLSLDFRFRKGREELDSRATRDFDRLLSFLRGHRGRLRLIGFSDDASDAARNVSLSLARARTISAELDARGVHPAEVAGLGSEMPVAPDDDPVGREKNRRVEVWLADE